MIRCFNHEKMSTMVCTFKNCQHKTLCADCIVIHPKNHLASILPIRDFDATSYTVPRLIVKDLSQVRQRMAMLQNHLIQTREQRKAEVKRLQKHINQYVQDEFENFLKSVYSKIEQFYNQNHDKVASVIQTCEDHLNKLNTIINGEVDDSRKFDFLLDLQDKLLQTIVPQLTQSAEEFSKSSMCSDLVVNNNYEKYLQVALEKAFNIDNILIKEKKPVTLEEYGYDSLAIFTNKQQPQQKGVNFYKSLIQPYLHQEIVYKDYKVPASADFNPKPPKEEFRPNAIPFEIFISQQKHLNTVIQGHFDIITSIAILSLNQIATGGGEGNIKFWDVDSQLSLGTIEAHRGEIWCLCPIYDEQNTDVAVKIASGGNDKVIHIWNVHYMTLEFTLIGHLDFVKSMCYLKKYSYICSGGGDYKIKVWNRDKCLYTIEDAHKNMIRTIIPILDDQFASGGDSSIRLWTGYKGQATLELSHGADVQCLLELPEYRIVSGGSDRIINIWDLKGGFKLQKLQAHHDSVQCLGFCKYLFSGSADKTLRVWDINEGKQIKSIKVHQEQISCLAVNSQRELIFTGSWDKRVRIVSLDYLMIKNNIK